MMLKKIYPSGTLIRDYENNACLSTTLRRRNTYVRPSPSKEKVISLKKLFLLGKEYQQHGLSGRSAGILLHAAAEYG